MSGSQPPCPSRDELEALLDDRLPEPQRRESLAHLRDCPPCSEQFSRLANTWSLSNVARAETPAGINTIAFRERLRSQRPDASTARAEIPSEPPEIAGYDSLQLVTAGGMGVVYRARDTTLGRPVAIKLISAPAILTASGRRRALREAELLARLSHPSICTIYAAGSWRDQPYLVMEWIEGQTLQHRIDAAPLSPPEAARIACVLAEAFDAVHAAGIVHRDLKPDNVLLANPSQKRAAVIPILIDFGLAHPDDASHELTLGNTVLGTPSFMAAEQTGLDESLGPVTPATDIHGLGGLLFAMLTGHAPYQASTLMASMQRALRGDLAGRERLAAVPDELRRIVFTCLQPQPAKRYASAAAVADALHAFLENQQPPVLAAPPSSRRLRFPLVWLLTTAALLLAIGMAVVDRGLFSPRTAPPSAAELTALSRPVVPQVHVVNKPVVAAEKAEPPSVTTEEASAASAGELRPEQQILSAINAAREQAGVRPLVSNQQLKQGAEAHAEALARSGLLVDLLQGEDSLGDRIAPTGYRCRSALQMIDAGVGPQDAVSRWIQKFSASVFLPVFLDVGIGTATGNDGRPYYVVLLAEPAGPQ